MRSSTMLGHERELDNAQHQSFFLSCGLRSIASSDEADFAKLFGNGLQFLGQEGKAAENCDSVCLGIFLLLIRCGDIAWFC